MSCRCSTEKNHQEHEKAVALIMSVRCRWIPVQALLRLAINTAVGLAKSACPGVPCATQCETAGERRWGSMIRRPVIRRSNTSCNGRLSRILGRPVTWCGIGLRRERVPAQRPEGPAPSRQRLPVPVRAMSAQVKLAVTVCSVRRGDRGSAPVTCLIHFQSSGSILTRPAHYPSSETRSVPDRRWTFLPPSTRPPQSALQLLGAGDVGVARVQWKRLHLATPTCGGRTALFADL
jgi:hypothetical protein